MGIRQIAMSPEPDKKSDPEPSYDYGNYGGYKTYPDNDRYDGEYDGSKYKEREDIITIKLNVTYKEIGKNFFDDEGIAFDSDKAELRAKEMAYDKTQELLGTGFESKYSILIEITDWCETYEAEIKLTPIKEE